MDLSNFVLEYLISQNFENSVGLSGLKQFRIGILDFNSDDSDKD